LIKESKIWRKDLRQELIFQLSAETASTGLLVVKAKIRTYH